MQMYATKEDAGQLVLLNLKYGQNFGGKGKGEIAYIQNETKGRWELGKSKNDGKRSRRV